MYLCPIFTEERREDFLLQESKYMLYTDVLYQECIHTIVCLPLFHNAGLLEIITCIFGIFDGYTHL